MKKKYYIYLTTNNVNGKKYIGQHYGLLNDNYFGSGVEIARAIEKYGKENFSKEILEITNKKDIDNLEKFYIEKYNAVENQDFYNISEGGQKGNNWKFA